MNNINNRKILIFMMSFFIVFVITSCRDRDEIKEKAMIAGTGIDRVKDKKDINLTVQVVLPGEVKTSGGGSSNGEKMNNAAWTVTSTGTSVFDAIRNFGLQSGRKALWSHNQVLVLGEEAAKQGVDEIIDIFERDNELRRRTWVLVSKGDAKDILEAGSRINRIPAFGIKDLIVTSPISAKAVQIDVHEFLELTSSKTSCAYATGIEVFDKEGEKDKKFRLMDTAVFKDYKLKGWLNQRETRGLLWVLGKVNSGIIEVECLSGEETPTSIEILRSNSKIIPEIQKGNLVVTIQINEEGKIGATPVPCADLSNPENLGKLEKKKAEEIKKEVNEAIFKTQEFNTDVFGFGQAFYRKYPKEWKTLEKEWDERFPNIKVKVEVNTTIKRTGLTTKPAVSE